MGVYIFVFIILMFQMINLTDTLLQHDVSLRTLIHLLSYMSISFLPALLPMSLIFAIILSYNRLTNDSEIIAMKSLGLSMWPLIMPGIALGLVVSIASGYMTFKIGPWGNRRFELLITDIANSKIVSAIKEGTFSEGFFNLVVYTN
ncbi:MAG: LptF/LptG family permease, partial [Bdellovibrionales bacterium]|nr:LptF/LptG family permease [Bdellovibrionales bacterium]